MQFIKNKWSDPVWSKVFAGIILSFGGIIASFIWTSVSQISFPKLWFEIVSSLSIQSDSNSFFDLSKKSNLLMWVSSGIFYLIAAIALSFQTLREKGSSLLSKIGTTVLGNIICIAISFVFFWVFSFIPQIDKSNWIWNYLVNIGIQLLIVLIPFTRVWKNTTVKRSR